MGFLKDPEEVARITRALGDVEFAGGEVLSASVEADPDVVRRLLPPGLQPAPAPRITAVVSRWHSSCVGDYAEGAVYLAATREGIAGDYVLTMFVDTDTALIFGREQYGEPKKLATSTLEVDGDRARGRVVRGGVALIEMEATLGADRGPTTSRTHAFNVKAFVATDGSGLEDDARLTLVTLDSDVRVHRRGDAVLCFGGTPHDPLDELPVRGAVRAHYLEMDVRTSCRTLARIPAESFLPYALGRLDDWSLLDTRPPAARRPPERVRGGGPALSG